MRSFTYAVRVDVPDDIPPRVRERLTDPDRMRDLVAACLVSELELPWGITATVAPAERA